MKFAVNRTDILDALKACKHGISRHSTLPVLGFVLIEATPQQTIRFTTTDLEFGIRRTIVGNVQTPGVTTVPFKLLLEYLSAGGQPELEFSLDNETEVTTVVSGSRTVKLHGLAATEFPQQEVLSAPLGDVRTTIDAADFASEVDRVARSASSDQSRPVLTGVLIETDKNAFRMAATDGHRLTVSTTRCSGPLGKSVILPAQHLSTVAKLPAKNSNITLSLSAFHVVFTFGGDTEVFLRVIDGQYPNYQQVIRTQHELTVTVDADELVRETKVVAVLAKDAANVIRLRRLEDTLRIAADTCEIGSAESTIAAESVGTDDVTIAINARYLLEAVTSLKTNTVRIGLNGSLAPLTVQSHPANGAVVVLMPVRVPA